jgi:competence protein ComGC
MDYKGEEPMKNEKGFTLIEMMIVLLVISVLLIITVPNITKHNSKINSKGCEAFIKMVQAQVQSYEIEHKKYPSGIEELVSEGYLKEGETSCPNGSSISISTDGEVTRLNNG